MSSTKKNIILQTTYQVAALITPFITAPYISRVLGVDNVGIYSYTYSIVNYFMVFAMLGLDIYGIRAIAKVKDNQNELNVAFSEILCAHVVVSVIVLLVYVIYCFNMPQKYQVIGFIQSLYIVGELLNINWLFNGLGEFKVTVIRNLLIKLLTIILIFVVVKSQNDLVKYVFVMALGTCISTSAVWFVRSKYVKFVKVSFGSSIKHLKPLTVLFVSIIASSLFRMIDKTMLGSFGYITELGCYEYADKFVRMPLAIITGIGTVMMSKTSNMVSNGDDEKVFNLMSNTLVYISAFASLIVFGFITFGSTFSVLYLGKDYDFTGTLLMILSVSLFIMAWTDTIRTQYFVPFSKDTLYAILTGVGALSNVVFNLILIPRMGASGAAIATDVSYLFLLIMEFIAAKNTVKFSKLLKKTFLPIGLGAIPFIVVFPITKVVSSGWISFIVQFFIFIAIFALAFLWYLKKIKHIEVMRLFERKH